MEREAGIGKNLTRRGRQAEERMSAIWGGTEKMGEGMGVAGVVGIRGKAVGSYRNRVKREGGTKTDQNWQG